MEETVIDDEVIAINWSNLITGLKMGDDVKAKKAYYFFEDMFRTCKVIKVQDMPIRGYMGNESYDDCKEAGLV